MYFFFFSSRRRHTRCALVTGFRRVLFRSGLAHEHDVVVEGCEVGDMLTEQVEGHVVGTLDVPGLELAGGAHVDDVHGRVLVAHADELAGGDGRRSSGPGISGGHRRTDWKSTRLNSSH